VGGENGNRSASVQGHPEKVSIRNSAQNIAQLPIHYGSSLDLALMRKSCNYGLSELFAFAACSENQFQNFLSSQISKSVRAYIGSEELCLRDLKYTKILIEEHIQHLQQTLIAIESGEKSGWVVGGLKSKATLISSDATPESTATCDVIADFEYLLGRAKALSARCTEGVDVIV
jgi:hypothetical protein